jgi:hypothetical protein
VGSVLRPGAAYALDILAGSIGDRRRSIFSDHIAGWVVFAIAVTALAEIARALRFLVVPIGIWIAASPFVLAGGGTASMVANVVVGLLIAGLSLPRGRRSEATYGKWNSLIV